MTGGALKIDPALHLRAPATRRHFGASERGLRMWTTVATSTDVASPGGYACRRAVTLTLLLSARAGPVKVKALAVPVTVVDVQGATFDGGPTSFVLTEPAEAVTLSWSTEDRTWLVS